MGMVWIALAVMVSATLIVNLGLGEAMAKVSGKILRCPVCLSFWASLAALLYSGADIVWAVALSISMSYLSNFIGIMLMVLNKWYDELWERSGKKE